MKICFSRHRFFEKIRKKSTFVEINQIVMKRYLSFFVALIATFATTAQNPEAIREMIRKNPNFAEPTVATYANIERGEVARAPKGFKPFHITIVGRHGSRYELRDTTFVYTTEIYNRAEKLGILTPLGKEICQVLNRATAEQTGRAGELAPLGQRQWREIGRRTYNNFKEVFDKGAIEGKSSVWMRCVISMVSFVDGLKEQNSKIPADIEARQEYLKIVRPMANYPGMPDEIQDIWDNYCKQHDKVWRNEFVSSIKAEDMKSMLSKVTTAPERLVSECGAPNLAHIFFNTHHLLLFAQNLEVADVDILTRTYTLDEQYICYLSKSINWLHWTGAWGNPRVEAYCSYFHPFIDDLFGNIESAIEGKNPYVANLRFTHDSYIMPLLTVLGYKDSALQYYGEGVAAWEKGATSAALSPLVPMAANLQIVLYRNKKGEVLVRSLLNENDVYLPVECATAPFYKWEDMRSVTLNNLARLNTARDKYLSEIKNK
jgi:hypothetical protein